MLFPSAVRDSINDLIRISRTSVDDVARETKIDRTRLALFLSGESPLDENVLLCGPLNEWAQLFTQRHGLRTPLISSKSFPIPMPSDKKPVITPISNSEPILEPDNSIGMAKIVNYLGHIRSKGMLCPIRIDESIKSIRYQDEFVWDVSNPGLTAETFTVLLLKDVNLPEALFKEPIKRSIIRQTTEFQGIMQMDPKAALNDSKLGFLVVHLDLTLNGYRLVDKIYWDPYSVPEAVELFASTMCTDLGLTGDWASKIAFDIRWRLLLHRKAVHFNQVSPIERLTRPESCKFTGIETVNRYCNKDFIQPAV